MRQKHVTFEEITGQREACEDVGGLGWRIIVEQEARPYHIAKTAIIGFAQGLPIPVAIEIARRMTPADNAPTFQQLETALDEAKNDLRPATA